MLRALARVPLLARQGARTMCMAEGVTIDQVSRVFSLKVKNDAQAHQMDLVMDEFLTTVAEQVDGYSGGSRLVCKSEWDYKVIMKFDDLDSLKNYMGEHHEPILGHYMPKIKELAVGGKVDQQNFVYDDIEP